MRNAVRVVTLASLGALLLACSSPIDPAPPDPTPDAGPPPVVKKPSTPVFIGTGGFAYAFGSAFAGATAPQGLAKVGPDTKGPWGTANSLHYCGYWYGDDTIQGFSHLHLHRNGATDYGLLALMPSDGFDASRTTAKGYESPFQKKTQRSSASSS
jgi:putative alpha-1,2-mannosidase